MNHILAWVLVISGIFAMVGGWAYGLEVLQDRITLSTKWRDLDSYQLEIAVLAIVGIVVFLLTLIVGAIIKVV